MLSNKESKEKNEAKATPVTIEFKNPSSAGPMEIAINHQCQFLVSDAINLIITKRMELKFQPSLSSIQRNIFLNHVYQGELEEAHVMLQPYPHTKAGADKLKVLLTTPAEIRNFLGRTLPQT